MSGMILIREEVENFWEWIQKINKKIDMTFIINFNIFQIQLEEKQRMKKWEQLIIGSQNEFLISLTKHHQRKAQDDKAEKK